MKLSKSVVVSFSLVAFAGLPAYAAETGKQGASSTGAAAGAPGQAGQQQQAHETRTSDLIGKNVNDNQGKQIGEIEDVVIDLQSGKVHAVVLSFGGILGIGEKNYAFPMSELRPGKARGEFMVNIDKQKLESAEGFAQNQWPRLDEDYWGRVGARADAAPGAAAGPGAKPKEKGSAMMLVRASELRGKQVQDSTGRNAGDVRDVVVDVRSGEVRHIVIDVDGAGDATVQANALKPGTDDRLVVNMTHDELKKRSGEARSGTGAGGSTGAPGRTGDRPATAPSKK